MPDWVGSSRMKRWIVLWACSLAGEANTTLTILENQHDHEQDYDVEEVALVVQACCLRGDWRQACKVLASKITGVPCKATW